MVLAKSNVVLEFPNQNPGLLSLSSPPPNSNQISDYSSPLFSPPQKILDETLTEISWFNQGLRSSSACTGEGCDSSSLVGSAHARPARRGGEGSGGGFLANN